MRIIQIGNKNKNINVFGDILSSIHAEKLPYTIYIVGDEFRDRINEAYHVPKDYRSLSIPSAGKVFVFDNAFETYESLSWLMVKELCHIGLRESFMIRYLFEKVSKSSSEEDFYDKLPDNHLCKELATFVIGRSYEKQ